MTKGYGTNAIAFCHYGSSRCFNAAYYLLFGQLDQQLTHEYGALAILVVGYLLAVGIFYILQSLEEGVRVSAKNDVDIAVGGNHLMVVHILVHNPSEV